MKTLYIDCGMGAAGDMLAGALLELLPNYSSVIQQINDFGIPGIHVSAEKSIKCGITGTHFCVKIHDHEEEHFHTSHHHHEHVHSHHHNGMQDIEHIISHLALPESVKKNVLAVYSLIAEAESHSHGVPVHDIHFHEVGTMDAIADIVSVCLFIHYLQPDKIIASPVHVGSGSVRCAHGILPVPAPATAYILQNVPIYGGKIQGELCTPTGAALLKHFVTEFSEMPMIKVHTIGYGMGKKDFEQANCVRIFLGETSDK